MFRSNFGRVNTSTRDLYRVFSDLVDLWVIKIKKRPWSFAHIVRRNHVNRTQNADHAARTCERFVYPIVKIFYDYQVWRTFFEKFTRCAKVCGLLDCAFRVLIGWAVNCDHVVFVWEGFLRKKEKKINIKHRGFKQNCEVHLAIARFRMFDRKHRTARAWHASWYLGNHVNGINKQTLKHTELAAIVRQNLHWAFQIHQPLFIKRTAFVMASQFEEIRNKAISSKSRGNVTDFFSLIFATSFRFAR